MKINNFSFKGLNGPNRIEMDRMDQSGPNKTKQDQSEQNVPNKIEWTEVDRMD